MCVGGGGGGGARGGVKRGMAWKRHRTASGVSSALVLF